MTWEFANGYSHRLPPCSFPSQFYFYDISLKKGVQVFSLNSCKVRGSENPKETLSLRAEPLLTSMSPWRSSPKGLRVSSSLLFGLAFSVKNCSVTVFTQVSAAVLINFFRASSAALNRGRRLFKNWTLQKNLFLFNLTAYLSSARKKLLLATEASFHCHHSLLSALFSGVFTGNSDLTLPFYNNPFFFMKRPFQCGFRLSF